MPTCGHGFVRLSKDTAIKLLTTFESHFHQFVARFSYLSDDQCRLWRRVQSHDFKAWLPCVSPFRTAFLAC